MDTTGEIILSGDPALDGPVKDPIEMIQKLAASERVKQVFVRHAFRFWMGRNETINDAPILKAAYQAYRENNGSMKALLTSLLTSDAYLYRKATNQPPAGLHTAFYFARQPQCADKHVRRAVDRGFNPPRLLKIRN